MAEEAQQEPVKKKSKKIIIFLLMVILLGGSGFAAYQFGLVGMILSMGETTQSDSKVADGAPAPSNPGTMVTVPTFVVNLSNPVGNRHIRLSMDLEMVNESAVRQLNQEMVKVRDSIIMLLSSKTFADLAPMEGKLQLKNEIVERVNLILGGPRVVKVYFTDMVFQ